MEELHTPVLLSEVLAGLAPARGEKYIDFTGGYGGHAEQILAATQNYKEAVLIDRDEFASDFLRQKFAGKKVKIVNLDFYEAVLREIECGNAFDLILADFGVSSLQLDRAERGFSFRYEGPLDMRMDQKSKLTASEIVNRWREEKIMDILSIYGEMREGEARRMARLIVTGRPWRTTTELAEEIAQHARWSRIHPATRAFQALRIAVNDELGIIEKTLPLVSKIMNSGARVGFITFQSLEDRLVKRFLKEVTGRGEESELEIINKKPIVAKETEVVINPRARSAKLRLARKK